MRVMNRPVAGRDSRSRRTRLTPGPAPLREFLPRDHQFEEREDGFLLGPKVGAGPAQGRPQKAAGRSDPVDLLGLLEPGVDLLVLLVESITMPPMFPDVIQREQDQILLGGGMATQQPFHQAPDQPDLRQPVEIGQHPFDLVKQGAKDRVLHYQGFRNHHSQPYL